MCCFTGARAPLVAIWPWLGSAWLGGNRGVGAWAPGQLFSGIWAFLLASMFSCQFLVKNRRFRGLGAGAAIFRDLGLPPGIIVFLLTSY